MKLWINEREYIAFNEKLDTLTQELASRRRAIDFYSLGTYLPNPDPVLKRLGKDITVYREILADSHVGACVKSRKAGVLSMEWAIDRGRAKSRTAKIVEQAFSELDLYRIISEILDAPLFGYAVLEVVWEKRGSYVLPAKVVAKPQSWFCFDENNELLLRTKDNYNGAPVPERKFLLVQYEASYENPYGTPELSRCFWPVTFKKDGLKFWVIFTEKYGMPYIVGKHPRGTPKEETDRLADMLEAMVQDAIAVIPNDASIEIMEAGGKSASASIYHELIDTCDEQISKAILGQTLTTQAQERGTQALGTVHLAVRKDIVDADKKLVESTLNRLIKWICEINFGDADVPVFSMWKEEDVDLTLAQRDEVLTRCGVSWKKEHFVREYGIPDDEFEIGIAPQSFAESESLLTKNDVQEQKAIDDAIESLSPEELQRLVEPALEPIIKLIKEGEDYESVMEKLVELYPKMNTDELQKLLERAIFVAEVWGRINARTD